MKVHLFGLPLSTHRRLKHESDNWREAVPMPHLFRATPTSTNEFAPFTDGEVDDLANAVAEGFAHIVIPANRNWRVLQSGFQFDCRVHIVRLWEPLRDITWELLKNRLETVIKLDELWLQQVCPADVRNPLLLPPPIFQTTRRTERYWQKCDVYSEGQIEAAVAILSVVEKQHRRPDRVGGRSWIDARNLRYRVDPSKHGLSAANRAGRKAYRFCFEVPAGFHYDVTDDDGRVFSISIDGKVERVTHCNITPWGRVRSG